MTTTTARPVHAAVALGSNLGDRAANIELAVAALGTLPGCRVLASSAPVATAAVRVGAADPGGEYLNAAALVETTVDPRQLLGMLHEIEHRLGRDRARQPHGAARTIDLDLVLHGNTILCTPEIELPHPRLHDRAFVLAPLASIAPHMVIPTTGLTVLRQLLLLSGE